MQKDSQDVNMNVSILENWMFWLYNVTYLLYNHPSKPLNLQISMVLFYTILLFYTIEWI